MSERPTLLSDVQATKTDRPNSPAVCSWLNLSPSEAARLRNELIASKFEVYVARDLITATHALVDLSAKHRFDPTASYDIWWIGTAAPLEGRSHNRSIPVILYSDIATAGERIQALELGAVDVLTKPFVSDELIARVRAALKARHSLSILEKRAHRDSLTGLANRGVLEDQLVRQWDGCRRRETPLRW